MARPLSLQCRGMSSVQSVMALEGRRYVCIECMHEILSSFVKDESMKSVNHASS